MNILLSVIMLALLQQPGLGSSHINLRPVSVLPGNHSFVARVFSADTCGSHPKSYKIIDRIGSLTVKIGASGLVNVGTTEVQNILKATISPIDVSFVQVFYHVMKKNAKPIAYAEFIIAPNENVASHVEGTGCTHYMITITKDYEFGQSF